MMLENVIEINAPPETVWAVTIDVERWPEWSPTMTSVTRLDEGPFALGSSARIKQPGLPEATWKVIAFTPGECFTWETRVRGLHIIATHEVSPTPAGTRSLLRVEFCGLLARIFWPLWRALIRRSLAQENAGLKKQCAQAT